MNIVCGVILPVRDVRNIDGGTEIKHTLKRYEPESRPQKQLEGVVRNGGTSKSIHVSEGQNVQDELSIRVKIMIVSLLVTATLVHLSAVLHR